LFDVQFALMRIGPRVQTTLGRVISVFTSKHTTLLEKRCVNISLKGAQGGFTFLVDRTKPFVTEARPGRLVYAHPWALFRLRLRQREQSPLRKARLGEEPLRRLIRSRRALSATPPSVFWSTPPMAAFLFSLRSPTWSLSAKLVEATDPETRTQKSLRSRQGEIQIIETEEGQKLKALVEAGYNPLVSSRGYGSLRTLRRWRR
jgi:hypothetical protein